MTELKNSHGLYKNIGTTPLLFTYTDVTMYNCPIRIMEVQKRKVVGSLNWKNYNYMGLII
jgi:hypothetical protein